MIPSRTVQSTIENIPSDWDLTSSATGTVKRRPPSLESCKSTSPSKNENIIDFPNDNCKASDSHAKDVVRASCKINKLLKSEELDLSQEGNSLKGNEDDRRKKINNQPVKKRFFDLKLTESAKKSFASRLRLPNRVSLTLSPRKNSANNKLSLSQLEQQNNLFIRDGQQQSSDNSSPSPEINKSNGKQNTMEKNESNNLKHKQESSSGGKSETAKNKRSSLIPSFLGGSPKSTNHIKIPSTSGLVKKATSSATVVEKLAKTGNKFKELYRDFPSSGEKSSNTSLKRNPPPYRPPPTPPTQQNKQSQANAEQRQKKTRFSENDSGNYEEIDPIVEETVVEEENKSSSNHDDISNPIEARAEGIEEEQSVGDMLTKAEYSSNVFKNIPVRQKKGGVPHMENYCLFDPSVDFTNEKELMKKKLLSEMNAVRQTAAGTSKHFQLNETEENIEDVTFEDQTVYDVSEHDERAKILAHHNYYEIDPDLLLEEEEEDETNVVAVEHIHIERHQVAKDTNRCQSVTSKHRKSKIYSNTLSMSSESTSTSQSSTNSSSSTTTSSDYPSLFNSVIETTHSSTVESTDDNDSNGYGKVKTSSANTHAQTNASLNGDTINQVNVTAVANESVIAISNVVTCGESNAATTGAKKKSPQLNRIIRPSSTRTVTASQKQSNKQQTSSLATKTKSNKISSSLNNKTLKLKASNSLPHLQNVTIQNRCRQQNELNFVIDNTTTIQLRRQHSRSGRPLSGHSDDRDSGFLSPVTPPDSQNSTHITPNVIIKESEQSTKNESTLLNQCDNIQQLIEVSPVRHKWRNIFFVVPFD